MPDSPAISDYLAAVLDHTSLSVQRRAEVASEIRDHIEERVASRTDTALPTATTIEGALAEFGNPATIRAALERHQRATDWRITLVKLRRNLPITIVGSVLFGILIAILSPAAPSATARVLGGLALTLTFAIGLSGFLLGGLFYETRLQHRLPRAEFSLIVAGRAGLRVIALGLLLILLWLMAALLAAGTFLITFAESDASGAALPYHFAMAVFAPGPTTTPIVPLLLTAILLVGGAFTFALYQRHYCDAQEYAY